MGIAAAIIGGAVIAGGAGIIGASMAGKAQVKASDRATQAQLAMYNQSRSDLAPWRDVGGQGLGLLAQYLGLQPQKGYTGPTLDSSKVGSLLTPFSPKDLANDPGYQFQLSEGNKNIANEASAGRLPGGYLSGATLKELLSWGQGLAGTTYNTAFNRNQAEKGNIYNWLTGTSGSGQTATNQTVAAGQQTAADVGSNLIGAGNARASSYMGSANAVGNAATSAVNSYTNYSLLKDILGSPSSGGGGGSMGYSPGMANLYFNPSQNASDYAGVAP
jgi:hypothetical protein